MSQPKNDILSSQFAHLLVRLEDEPVPGVEGVVGLQAVVGDVVGEEAVEALRVDVRPVLDVVLLRRDHR